MPRAMRPSAGTLPGVPRSRRPPSRRPFLDAPRFARRPRIFLRCPNLRTIVHRTALLAKFLPANEVGNGARGLLFSNPAGAAA